MPSAPRVALGGFMLESNSHAAPATRAEFERLVLLAGPGLLADLRAPAPRSARTATGFLQAMDASGPWTPVPTVLAMAGASGSCEQGFFDELVDDLCARLRAALPLDGVYLALHGAADAQHDDDPDGTLLRRVREVVGPQVPVVATLDLHANVSAAMVRHADVLVAFRTNPHVDMRERGEDCARHLRALLGGMRVHAAFRKLPLAPPTVTQGTAPGLPYREILDFAQARIRGPVIDVSVAAGFTLGDTPKNGLAVIATATDRDAADQAAREVAALAWSLRHRFVPRLVSVDDAVRRALEVCRDPQAAALLLADVADNPGGGGRGNTTWILRALHEAGVQGAVLGPFCDAALAAQAHRLGEGASFEAVFNREGADELSQRWSAVARVAALGDGGFVARRGIFLGRRLQLGPSALLDLGGVQVVVGTNRHQASDPGYFEMLGVDLSRVRVLVVKSRGHFRAAFDEWFGDDRILEVDAPGLTTPVMSRVPWRRMPRPMYPLDAEVEWVCP